MLSRFVDHFFKFICHVFLSYQSYVHSMFCLSTLRRYSTSHFIIDQMLGYSITDKGIYYFLFVYILFIYSRVFSRLSING